MDSDIYDENRTYEPLKVFVNPNQEFTVPEGYENYSSGLIQGFLNGLVGMKEGENKTVVIPPEEGYGIWNATLAEELWMQFIQKPYLPRTFSDNLTSTILKTDLYNYNTTIDIENITENQTFTYLEGFTPEGNATLWQIQITNISGDNVTILNVVDNGTILKSEGSWDNVVVIENETVVTVKAIPEIGGIYGQQNSWIKVLSVNETAIIVAINMESPEKKFIDQTLVFELEVVEIYKTSEELS